LTLVIGLDLGTTSCKAVALHADGHVVASASNEYTLQLPRPGWVQQDVLQVWQGVVETLRTLADELPDSKLDGLCLSGAMHSVLPVGRDDVPLAPAMTWADQRAANYVEGLRRKTEPHALYQRTGCPLRSTYHHARLRWWLEQATALSRRAVRFAAIKDWILHRLTGVWATDLSLASATGLLNMHRLCWDDEALSLAGISADRLPRLMSPTAIVGGLAERPANVTGLPSGLLVIAGAGDGGLANLGAGAGEPGQVVVTIGTSGAIRRVVNWPQLDAEERTWCYVLVEGRWFVGGAINNGGLTLQWVRDRFYSELPRAEGYEAVLQDAASVSPGAGGVMVLPYFSGERSPHWSPKVRALFHGLGLEHTRAHVARAALEGVAFCMADVWQALSLEANQTESARLTGGITRAPIWAQILADVLGVPLVPVKVADASALGAALLGHRALGREVTSRLSLSTGAPFEPDSGRHGFYQGRHQAFQSLYRLLQ
jgi:gluconokinase